MDSKRRGAPPKYPWRNTEIGGSFYIGAEDENELKLVRSRLGRAAIAQKKNGLKFRIKTMRNDGSCGIKVERIS